MLARLRAPTAWRGTLAALAVLALALKLLVPAGFMPGTSLSAPIVLCPDQGAMPMAMGGHHHSTPMHHGGPEHQCAFAGLGAAAVAAPLDPPVPIAAVRAADLLAPVAIIAAPGRGLAAPPPPSHAPPILRA